MRDEGDTTCRRVCEKCGEIIETDYAQMPFAIMSHQMKCPAKSCGNCYFNINNTCDGKHENICPSWKEVEPQSRLGR